MFYDQSRLRGAHASLASYVLFIAMYSCWWLWYASVSRARLVTQDVASLRDEFRTHSIPINIDVFHTGHHHGMVENLKSAFISVSSSKNDFLSRGYHFNVSTSHSPITSFRHFDQTFGELHSYMLLFHPCIVGRVCPSVRFGQDLSATVYCDNDILLAGKQIVPSVINALGVVWFRTMLKDEYSVASGPSLQLELVLVSDGGERPIWNASFVTSFFSNLYYGLDILYDLRTESSVAAIASAGSHAVLSEIPDRADVVSVNLQSILSKADQWISPTVFNGGNYSLPSLLRLAGFLPSRNVSWIFGQHVVLPGWGFFCSLSVVSRPRFADVDCPMSRQIHEISRSDAQYLARMWTSYLRSMLSLEPMGPDCSECELRTKLLQLDREIGIEIEGSDFGMTSWEFGIVVRRRFRDLVQSGIRSLHGVAQLISSMPNLEVKDSVARSISSSVDLLRSAIRCGNGICGMSTHQRLLRARRGLALALDALHDEHLVGLPFFSWEYTCAVYLPIGLPVIVPCLAAIARVCSRLK